MCVCLMVVRLLKLYSLPEFEVYSNTVSPPYQPLVVTILISTLFL